MDISKLLTEIHNLCDSGRTAIIGIDGLGGAGKSTVSDILKTQLTDSGYNVTLLHIDDFIHPRNVRYNSDYAEWECYYNLQWRYDYLINEVLKPVRSGADVIKDIELYDKDNDTYYPEAVNITAMGVVIIEGIFLQREELRSLFDFVVYIDISEETRLARVLLRDGYIGDESEIRKKYENRYFPAERHYFKTCSPHLCADLVIKE